MLQRFCVVCRTKLKRKSRSYFCCRSCRRQHEFENYIRITEILLKEGWPQPHKRIVTYYQYRYDNCFECGQGRTWNDKKLMLQLDHKDGDRNNNTIDNLRLLCPNCHTQTPTHSRNKKKDKGSGAGMVTAQSAKLL